MAMTIEKKKKMTDLIYKVFGSLDPSGQNTEKYKNMFESMSLNQFDAFCKKLFSNKNNYLILDIADYERHLKMEHIKKAAKVLNIPLFEKMALPYENMDTENPVITKYPVPVGYMHLKRMQQMLNKKNSTSTEASSRNMLSGQVSGHDKNSRSSDMENYNLCVLDGLDNVMKEFLGPRADDLVMQNEMEQQIATNGVVSIKSMTNDVKNKTALNTLNVFMLGMGLQTDLVTKNMILPKTIR